MSKFKKIATGLAISSSIILTGCALSPGAQLDPESTGNVRFNLVNIDESSVNREPVSRKDLAGELSSGKVSKYEYRIGAHDILGVRVWNNPDLTTNTRASSTPFGTKSTQTKDSNELVAERQQVTPEGVEVQSSGTFFFPFAGEVQAEGKTISEVRTLLTEKLSMYVKDPQVSVRVQEFNSQQAQIIGEVDTPRPLSITSKPLRILDAITLAGGMKESADRSEAILVTSNQRKIVNMAELLDGDMSQNFILKDGDVLNIDTNRYRQIVIMGEVNKPVAMAYDQRGMSLNDALVAASGINQNYANATGIYILRNMGRDTVPTIYRLDMANATGLLLADRFPLEARDVVYVDTAAVSRWNRVINQILPTTSAISDFTK